jgi:hypothetical protein
LKARVSEISAPALALTGPLAVYAASAARDLGPIDSGELATVCANLGVAHPTGYPLYTLVGHLAAMGLPGPTPIARLNLLSGIFAATACLFTFLLFRAILARLRPRAGARSRDLLALGAAWLWAIHPALWSQAVVNEVHALQVALLAGILWLAAEERTENSMRWRVLTAYATGLAFTNHMSTVYLLPGLAVGALVDQADRAWLRERRHALLLAGATLVPLGLYGVLPLLGLREPLMDWGAPTTWSRFLRHVGGAQYRVWMFSSSQAFRGNLAGFLREWVSPVGWIPPLAAIAGAWTLARRDRPVFFRLTLGFLVGVIWASGYDIHDIEPYYATARLCLAGLALAGVSAVLPERRTSRARDLVVLAPLLAALVLGGLRYRDQSRRGDHFVRLYAQSLLDRLPPDAILISRHWDMVVSPIIYLQQVEHRRPDVTVVDTELLRRSWYYPQLRRTDPRLLAPIEDRVSAFLEDLRLFEAQRPYDPRRIEERYRALIAGIFTAHRTERPVFHTPDVEPLFYGDWTGIPEALAVRMVSDPRAAPAVEPLDPTPWEAQVRFLRDPVCVQAWGFPIELAHDRIRFLRDFGRMEEAARWQQSVARFEAVRPPEGGGP